MIASVPSAILECDGMKLKFPKIHLEYTKLAGLCRISFSKKSDFRSLAEDTAMPVQERKLNMCREMGGGGGGAHYLTHL